MRWAALTLAALLGGCSDGAILAARPADAPPPALRFPAAGDGPARTPAPPSPPRDLPSARSVHIQLRRPGGEEVWDEVDILSLLGREDGGRQTLTRIRVWSHSEERALTQAISQITCLQPAGAEEITGKAAIMLWLRELGGIATDADREAAGLEAADAVAMEAISHGDGEQIAAHGLRLRAWITYEDRDGARTKRPIVITSLHGEQDEDGWVLHHVEAYCGLRQAHRTFLVERMLAIGTAAPDLIEMDPDAISDWLLAAAEAARKNPGRKRPHG
jgi:hypothetical protein